MLRVNSEQSLMVISSLRPVNQNHMLMFGLVEPDHS